MEDLFDNREFQTRLEGAVRPFRRVSTVLGVFGVGAVALFTFAGNRVYENLRALETKTAELRALTEHMQQDAKRQAGELEKTAKDAAREAERASIDAQKHASSLDSQRSALLQSTTMVTSAIGQMSHSLEESRKDLDGALKDVGTRAQQFSATQAQQAEEQRKIKAAQDNIAEAQKGLDALRSQINKDITNSLADIKSLRKAAQELANSKTLELVSLRAGSKTLARLQHVEETPDGWKQVPYDLRFTTGKLKPLVVSVQTGQEAPVTYRGVDTDKTNPDREAYCICGTPFMFRVENYVQEMLMHDFVMLKVLDRTSRCQRPPDVAVCR